jgi:hypothetical protein
MTKYRLKTNKKVEDGVVNAYNHIENRVVGTYQKIENAFVEGYKGLEESFVEKFLEKEPENDNPEKD